MGYASANSTTVLLTPSCESNVRFGSLADICSAKIRFTPKSGHSRMTCAKKVEPLLPQSGSLDGNHSLWH